jgi:2Fe-2S ferredoxin
VAVNPGGYQFPAADGESVMEAAERAGLTWPTLCGGVGMCTMCWFRPSAATAASLSPMGPQELEALNTCRWDGGRRPEGNVRLGCQARVHGDIELQKRGVNRAARAGLYR